MNLLGKGNDPKFWSETVRNRESFNAYREFLLEKWNDICVNDNFDALKYTEFRLYGLTGNRTVFQAPYYKHRVQMEVAAVLALIYPEEEKYLEYAMDKVFAVCNEYSWSIPAHIPRSIEVVNRTHLDLFACETAYTLSEIYTLLEDRLDTLIKERIKAEIKWRVIDSFRKTTTWGWATTNTANWAAVCAGSVGCTLMLLFPELFDEFKPRLDLPMENFLSGYEEDGFCAEGTHYWHYGFGFFCAYAEMLRTFTGGKEDYFKRPKVHAIATFIQKMFLSGKKSVSFSDGAETLEYHIGLLHFLKNEYSDVVVYSPKYSYILDACGRFNWLVRGATWFDEEIYNNPAEDNASSEYYGQDTQWLIKRTSAYGFAAKAGHNNEPHNQNDVGAFIIAKNEKQIVTDLGPGVYSQQYFHKDTRYSFIECSSLGHSVPFFGETIQKFGGEFASTDTKFENGVFSTDIAGAYGSEEVKSIKRSFSFTETSITLNDKFVYTGSEKITDRISLHEKPAFNGDNIVAGELTIKYNKAACEVVFNEQQTSKNTTVYFIDFVLRDGVDEITIIFE
ncbi:MAG: hypothetical protein E7673_06095 [Ruminococcaceae bacterium]|nr:hypothetical protein [Oscillospiraceae bacterium]